MNKPLVVDVYKLHGSAIAAMANDASLEEALGALIREPALRGIFLVDSKQRYVGMVARVNLIRWAHFNITGGKGRYEIPIWEYFRIMDARKATDLVIKDPRCYFVKEGDTLQTALDKMLDYEEDIIPVLDDQDRILGDLRLSEVLWWVLIATRE